MDLTAWLHYLETLHPKAIDLGLERVERVAKTLDLLPWHCPTITVTGTNGKGSCVAILESVLSAAGYRVGAYTSPHLFNYNERIRIQGQPVSDAEICEAFEQIEKARGNISLTYFEFGTLAALLLFRQANLDRVILEVGLGGRLDAVNIIDADIAIITTIALDHQDWLGPDRESIGREKAAIARPNKPLICGEWDIPVSVIASATKQSSVLYCQGIDFGYDYAFNDQDNDHGSNHSSDKKCSWWGNSRHLMGLPIPVLELQNMATALKAIELLSLSGVCISREAIEQGLRQVRLPGRFQVIEGPVTHIFDVAHNPAAAACLARRLSKLSCAGRTIAVMGVLADKDQAGIMAALDDHIQAWFVGTLPSPRGGGAGQMDIVTAYRQALLAAQPGDRIIVFGSHHTVAIVFTYYRGNELC